MPKKEKIAYEDAIERLEGLIAALESGEIPLADLVSKFEEGSKLLKHCREELKEAELKIQTLNKETGSLEAFEDAEES